MATTADAIRASAQQLIYQPSKSNNLDPYNSPVGLPRSWSSIALGTFFAATTARVLFDDVVAGAPVSTTHALSLAALVAALASGHMALPELRARRVLTGAALGVLFLASTVYVAVSSGARNAEVASTKAASITANNEARQSAVFKLANAERDLTAAKAFHLIAVNDAATECKSGKGKRCDGASSTRDAAHKNVETGESHVTVGRQDLDRLKPIAVPNGGYAHAAKVVAAFGIGDAADIEARLTLVLPFLTVLICELGTITFLGMGLGRRAPIRQVAHAADLASATFNPVRGTPLALPPVPATANTANSAGIDDAVDANTGSRYVFASVPSASKEAVGQRLVDMVREQGGTVEGSVRAIARRIGAKPTTVHGALVALAGAGVIAFAADRSGTLVRLTG
jgi:hypothetical protein